MKRRKNNKGPGHLREEPPQPEAHPGRGGAQMYFSFRPGGVGQVSEQMCDFEIMGRWYSRVPQNHHGLHRLLGRKDMH